MSQITIEQALQIAIGHHQKGQRAQAEAIYRQILTYQPNYAVAWHLLGVLAGQDGRWDQAIECIRKAIAIHPIDPVFHSNLGKYLTDQRQFNEAIAALREAIRLDPTFGEAFNNLGIAFQENGQGEKAIAAYRQAVALKPDLTAAHHSLGVLLQSKGDLEGAIGSYRAAIRLNPGLAEAFNNLGEALRRREEYAQALAACREAVRIRPDFAEAHNNLGNILQDQGFVMEAAIAYGETMRLNPNLAEPYNNLGRILHHQELLDESIAHYRRAIELKPHDAQTHDNLGIALKDAGELNQAMACARRAVELDAGHEVCHSNLIVWLNYDPSSTPQTLFAEARNWARQHAGPLRERMQPHANDRDPDRPLRIGYVSSDFCQHASACFLMPLLRHHDPAQVEIICYSQVRHPDDVTRLLQKENPHWRNTVGISDARLAEIIREDHIDILVDLKLHTGGNRLLVFARQPAPVQVTWLGYPGTTGLETIDYRLTDPYLDPPTPEGQDTFYSEKSIRLPETYWCYDPLESETAVGLPPALKNGFITFGCLNAFCKINESVLELWADVLRRVKNSRLLILAPKGGPRGRLVERLRQREIGAQRLEFFERQPRPEYLGLYHRIDIGLDTFPYNGHTTSLDSFWMGVPVVTLVGKTVVGRGGLSQLMNLGMPELIARSPDEYMRIAAELAGDMPRLAAIRAGLRTRMIASPLMDAPRFTRHIEAAYREMWKKWCLQAVGCNYG